MIIDDSTPGTALPFSRVALGPFCDGVPDAFVLAFDVSTCDAADFARHGIACPASIQRSVPKRRAEYLAGRRAAVAALREQGAVVSDLDIGDARAPAWPAGFTGSITHTDGIAAAVAMPSRQVRGIGIDIEHLVGPSAIEAIRQSVVDAGECAQLGVIAGRSGWPFALTLAFSAKESFYKATAATVGRFFDFSALRIVDLARGDGLLDVEVTEHLAPALRAGMRFCIGYGRIDDTTLITSFMWDVVPAE